MKLIALPLITSALMLSSVQSASAVEVLSASELALHCKEFPADSTGLDGEFCARYIQGFIDGAVSTDARVMLNVEADIQRKETFSERAMRTRLPNRDDFSRAARYAEFCLGDPVPLKDVVNHVVNDLSQYDDLPPSSSARDIVYTSLKKHYPCDAQ